MTRAVTVTDADPPVTSMLVGVKLNSTNCGGSVSEVCASAIELKPKTKPKARAAVAVRVIAI